MIKYILISIWILSTPLFAQTNFRPGVVYLLSGDSLVGYINYRGSKYMQEQCLYKSSLESQRKTYLPLDILGYRFVNGKYFVSNTIHVNNKMTNTFIEFLVKGKMNLYYYKTKRDYDAFFVSTDTYPLIELPYTEGYSTHDSKMYYYKSRRHKSILHKYLNDAPSLAPDIDKIHTPDYKPLISLAIKYHAMVSNTGGKCIVYYKK